MMKKGISLLIMALIGVSVWGQWDLSNSSILYRKQDSKQIILKTSRSDNTQEGTFSIDGWGNFAFGRNLNLGGYLSFYGDNNKTIIRTSRTDNTQIGTISTNGWGSFKFNNSIMVNDNLYVGQGQSTGRLILRSGNYQREVKLLANDSYSSSENTYGLRILPNRILDLRGHYITDGSKTFTILSASRSDGTSYNELVQHKVYNGTNNHDLNLVNNGRVGIGTTTPDAKLDVAGNIKAQEIEVTLASIDDMQLNGTLAANQITVTTNGQTADFVFEEDYELRDLQEVETFIKSNKHLPDIPSAAAMEENGVNLAEMNKLLLLKIEELTLYAIDKDNRIQELEAERAKQKAEVETQKEKVKSQNEKVESLEERLAKIEALLLAK